MENFIKLNLYNELKGRPGKILLLNIIEIKTVIEEFEGTSVVCHDGKSYLVQQDVQDILDKIKDFITLI